MGRIIMALLPVVLSMLANRQGNQPGAAAASRSNTGSGDGPAGFGGLGGLGGLAGMAGMAGMGGLGGLLEQFSRRGYASQASSWVGTGPNEPLPPQAVSEVFNPQQLADIAARAGVSQDEARLGLSHLLPEVVNQLTPSGELPPRDQLLASVDDYVRQLGR